MHGTIPRPEVRRLLLSLLADGPGPGPERLRCLSSGVWDALDDLAGEHRIRPLLHHRRQGEPLAPEHLRARWKAAHREAGITAVTQRADLLSTVRLLRGAGIEPLAMKGAWLAWHAYPQPALRPMRDLDLLVAPDRFVEAVRLLLAGGYHWAEEPDLGLEDIVRFDKSPPPLIAPRGTGIELHLRAWFPSGRLEYPSPEPDDAGMFARSRICRDGVRHPGAGDMLAHLVIHALYSHRLDCGPLLLTDIAALVERDEIDWPAFWERARREDWRDAARLVLDLVLAWQPATPIDFAPDTGPRSPDAVLRSAPDLLLQDLEGRYSAGFAAAALTGGMSALWRRLRRRVTVAGTAEGIARQTGPEESYASWATTRLKRTVSDLFRPEIRRQARDMARLNRWLSKGCE